MKILYITSHLDGEGSFFVLKGLFHALRESGDEITYVNLKEDREASRGPIRGPSPVSDVDAVPTPGAAPGMLRALKSSLNRTFPATKRIVFDNLRSLRRHWQLIRDSDADVIVGRNASTGVSCLIAYIKGIPFVNHIDGIHEAEAEFGNHATRDYRLFAKLGRGLFRWLGSRSVVVTDAVKQVLVDSGIPPENVTVLGNGVDVDAFKPDTKPHPVADRLRDKIVVGFVGSFKPWHQVDRFMEQIPEVVRENPDVAFLFLGKPRGSTDLDGSRASGNVLVLEAVPHEKVPSVIACFDIGILPFTAHSCSPLKIYEYMAMGKPTIAPRWPAIEAVIDHQKDGYLFEPDDMEALRTGVLRLAGDREAREVLGYRARQKMVEQFTWKKCADKFRNACAATIESARDKQRAREVAGN